MRSSSLLIVSTFVVVILCGEIFADESNSARAIQILTPVNHSFHLELSELKAVLEKDDIKDRHVVVVSIAGAFRQGKSFLLNFFIKYLQAQYKTHDVSDWIGEHSNHTQINGFKFRGGRKPETSGIWMWSDIFTHDYANGEKVAIILIDTQGIFDSKSSVRDCTTVFALSTLLSSVQCYNLMQNIREDDLQHLQLFMEYGRLALEQSNEKPFQKLLFIIRDWPYAYETNYGWDGQKVINDFLAEINDQTPEMHQLRARIRASFAEIQSFLMPHPGFVVSQGNNFTGNLRDISTEFLKYVKQLVPAIFAPENLIVKKINGQKMRARDLIQYLQAYTNVFNGNTLPEPKPVYRATAEAFNHILYTDCLDHYIDSMQMSFNKIPTYLKEPELLSLHQNAKNKSLAEFLNKPKLGGDEVALPFQQKLETGTEEKFQLFKSENEQKRQDFIRKANLHNENIGNGIYESIARKIHDEIRDSKIAMKQSDLNSVFGTVKQSALEEFNRNEMGGDEVHKGAYDKLIQNVDNFHLALTKTFELYGDSQNHYRNSMQNSLDRVEYFHQGEFTNLHQNTKNQAISQFMDKSHINDAIKFTIRIKLDSNIDEQFHSFNGKNATKHANFITRANSHNDNLCREMKWKFETRMRKSNGKIYFNDNAFIDLFLSQKQASLNEFGARKMGDVEISNAFRERLERDLDGLQASLKQLNEANKPPPPPPRTDDGRNRVEQFFHRTFGW